MSWRDDLGGPKGEPRIEFVRREPAFEGFFRLDRVHMRHLRYDGQWTPVFTREIFERGESACILLYDPKLSLVVLVEQFRGAAARGEAGPWLVEVVAGIVEGGESPESVARREAVEEAGCTVSDIIHIGKYWLSPGGTSERTDLYVGRVDASAAGGIHGLEEEVEDIRVVVVPLDEAVAACGNQITTAPAVILLQWLALQRNEVARRWGVEP
ncbi:MAG: ADP-ribose diphosphatase [Rhodospirillaceae bacterium]|nr:ADP-ribose diphosphatase [Rhodospirillaceae bacterium]